jgi:putative DNA primase/helicase
VPSEREYQDRKQRARAAGWAGTDWELKVTPISSVKRRPVEWLWVGRLAIGKLALLEGDPGGGKSWLTLGIATAIAHGAPFPVDSQRREPGRVLLMAAEDSLDDTIGPRLDSMGADTSRIEAIESASRSTYTAISPDAASDEISTEQRAIFLTEDLGRIERVLSGGLYKLLIIDPLNAYIPASVDSAKDNAIRSTLAPLVMMAERYGVAVLAVRHLTKGSRDKAIYRGQGSIGYTAAARIVLLAGQEVNNGGRRVLMPIKCNLAPLADPITYSIEGGRFAWGVSAPGVKPEAVLAAEPEEQFRTGTAEAGDLLVDFLSDGDQPAADAQKHVRQRLGCSVATVERAKRERHIVSQRRGFGRQSEVYWHLPKAFQPTLIDGGERQPDNTEGETSSQNLKREPSIGVILPVLTPMTPMENAQLETVHSDTKDLTPMAGPQGEDLDGPSPEQLARAAAEQGPPEDLDDFAGDDDHFTGE